jgi:hypothetical protein
VLIQVAALKINQEIRNSLQKLDGGVDNPYSVFTHPREFVIRKYLIEQMGMKFNMMTSPNF